MTKVSKTFSINAGLMARINADAEKNGINMSKQLQKVVRSYYDAIDRKEQQIQVDPPEEWQVSCEECGANYSKKLDGCPTCTREEEADDILNAEPSED